MPASSKKCRRYIREISSSTSPISSGRRRSGAGALMSSHFRRRRLQDARASGPPLWLGCGSGPGRLLVPVLDRRELEPVLALDVDLHGVAARVLQALQVLRELFLDLACQLAPLR